MQRIQPLKTFFFAPVFANDIAKTSRARLLSAIFNFCLGGLLLVTVGNFLGGNVSLTVSGLNGVAILLLLFMRFWLHRGHTRLLSMATLIILYVFQNLVNFSLGTIRTPTASTYLLLVAIGGILFGVKGTAVTTVAGSLAVIGLIVAENAGLLPQPDFTVGITQWISYTVFMVTAGTLATYALHTIQQALDNASHELKTRQQAEEQIRLLSRAVEASPVSIVMTDLAGDIIYVNPRFSEVTGYSFQEVIGRNPRFQQSGQTPPETHKEMWQTILAGEVWSGEFLNQRRDGSLYWETAVISPIIDPASKQITHFIAVKEDVTERKQAEASLRHLNKELQERNKELDAFAHTVAHDLKNPVGLLVGFSEILLESHQQMSAEKVEEILGRIASSARKTNRIIDELLLLASVQRQDITLAPLNMHAIVEESLVRLTNNIATTGALIVVGDMAAWPQACGYGPWVEEVWVNYLSNALKYSGQPPYIQLNAQRQADGFIRFSVTDKGPGLTPEQQQRLFTPFERLNQARSTGHGLGLSIVQRIVTRLDGTVGVISEAGMGSTFFFTLPAANGNRADLTGQGGEYATDDQGVDGQQENGQPHRQAVSNPGPTAVNGP